MLRRPTLLRTLALLTALAWQALPALAGGPAPQPKLVVVISVDQLSAERLEALRPRFTGGLARLLKEGLHFTRAYHAHAGTETGPGHSVLLTGCHPAHTGIPENEWFDLAAGREMYCVEDPKATVLGAPDASAGPRNLQRRTLGEYLKEADPRCRSFALTGKDRSAILMAGHVADGVYWWHPKVGFTTSTAYAATLPPWLQAHNAATLAKLQGQTLVWEALDGKPRLMEAPGGVGRNILFGLPKTIKAGGEPISKAGLFQASPWYDATILEAAEALIQGEKLGRGPRLDLLALGLSGTDYVGHRYGPGGPEMEDQLLRLDLLLEGFLKRLRARTPHALVVLTSDHACADFPERLQAEGKLPRDQAFRLDPKATVYAPLNAHLREAFQLKGDALLATGDPRNLSFNRETLASSQVKLSDVVKAAQAWMQARPFVLASIPTEELARHSVDDLKGKDPEQLSMVDRLRLSLAPGKGGDLVTAFGPHILFIPLSFPATHGSPHDYDRHVPILVWGAGKARKVETPVSTVDILPSLAAYLGLDVPDPVDGVVRAFRP